MFFHNRKRKLERICRQIQTMEDSELQACMRALERRYQHRHPDWDIVYIAVPKDPVQRKTALAQVISLMEQDVQWHTAKQ